MKTLDYKRIQTTLIIVFSILNIYLITILLEKNDELNFGDPSTSVNLEEGMRNDSIQADELSNEQQQIPVIKTEKDNYLEENMKSLSNQTTQMEDGKLISVLTEAIELDMAGAGTILDKLAPLLKFMSDGNVLKAEEYTYFSYQPINQRIIFVQKHNNIPITDGTASLIFYINSDGEVSSYDQTHVGASEVQGKDRTVISEKAAIESLYLNNQIPNNSKVTNITLSYFQTLSLNDMNIYSPMWYVEIVRENIPIQIKRVDALTGSVITAPVMVEPEADPASQSSNGAEVSEADVADGFQNLKAIEAFMNETMIDVEAANERVYIERDE